MRYLIALLIPPLATLLMGKWIATIVCLLLMLLIPLSLITWPIAIIVALFSVNDAKADRRIKKFSHKETRPKEVKRAQVSNKEAERMRRDMNRFVT